MKAAWPVSGIWTKYKYYCELNYVIHYIALTSELSGASLEGAAVNVLWVKMEALEFISDIKTSTTNRIRVR